MDIDIDTQTIERAQRLKLVTSAIEQELAWRRQIIAARRVAREVTKKKLKEPDPDFNVYGSVFVRHETYALAMTLRRSGPSQFDCQMIYEIGDSIRRQIKQPGAG